ncbi:MAG: redox-sensing transcriptional repressor Rex [Clostridia bacterium]|nr:redox-sensing transcriptional repressor Rex [Clostridia bacterium]
MSINKKEVSRAVVSRLPNYYRFLSNLEKSGLVRISSQELGNLMGLTASQIRQDMNCFGGFGQQGYGYNVMELRRHIGEVLGLTRKYSMVIVGAGNIGQAVAGYNGFRKMGFSVEALFDEKPKDNVRPVSELAQYVRENNTDIGVIAVPEHAAQAVCDTLCANGIKAIWNFAPVNLVVPQHVILRSVHLSDALLVLSYYMKNDFTKGE